MAGSRKAYAPEFKLNADGTRKFPVGSTLSMLAAPGTYTVKLIAGDVERSGPLVVRKDPNRIVEVSVDSPGILVDVDTPEDFRALQDEYESR